MASDAYISSYDSGNAKTTHINSSGAITALMLYAVYDRQTRTIQPGLIFPDSTTAETGLRDALTKRGNASAGRLCVITVPA